MKAVVVVALLACPVLPGQEHHHRDMPAMTMPQPVPENALTLAQLEQMALTANPALAEAQAEARAAAGLAHQAGLYPNPVIGYYGDEIRGGFIGGGKQGVFLSQDIVLGGKLGAGRRVAEQRRLEAETSAGAQRSRIRNNVRVLFYQALAAQRLVDVQRNLVKLARDAATTSHQLNNAGQADQPDVLQAEVETGRADLALSGTIESQRAAWKMLAIAAGRPELPLSPLAGDLEAFPELDEDGALQAFLDGSSAVKLAAQDVDRAQASLTSARKAPIPDLQITGTLAQNYEPLETTLKPTGLMGGAQIGIRIPLFDRNQGNIEAAKADVERAKQEPARMQLLLRREFSDLFRDYAIARNTVERYRKEMLPRAQKAYDLYRTNYQNMAGPWPPVLMSQRTLFELQSGYVNALAKVWTSAVAIQGSAEMDGLTMTR